MNLFKDFKIGGSRLLTHIIFWMVVVLGNTIIWGSRENEYFRQFIIEMISLPYFILAAYLNLYILLPRYLVTKKYTQYFIYVLVLLVVSSNLNLVTSRLLSNIYPWLIPKQPIPYLPTLLWHMFWVHSPIMFVTSCIKLYKQWYIRGQQNQELEKEKLIAELDYLKGQVQPHFLFNTLNNLYSLTLHKSEAAPQIILKLSALMSYMLYDSRENKIELCKELEHIKNYIDLEKLRFGDRLAVSFNIYGEMKDKKIAPLLLIPFVENAFKHGASTLTKDCWVTIDIKAKEDFLIVKVENNKSKIVAAKVENDYRNGIGLTNVQRRLALLYGGRHNLHIEDEPEHFAIDLKLDLNETRAT
jgi:two-component system LytT family sensor kinase